MFLQDTALIEAIESRRLVVKPVMEGSINPGSIDLHVGRSFARWKDFAGQVNAVMPRKVEEVDDRLFDLRRGLGEGDEIVVKPQEHLLVSTLEWVEVADDLIAFVEGKSTIGRAGLQIKNAGLVDNGWKGVLTYEFVNQAPIPLVVTVGNPIAQLVVAQTLAPAERPYGHPTRGSRYQGDGIVSPPKRLYWGFGYGSRQSS